MSKQIEVLSAVHGIAPRSDDLLRLGGDVSRGRASQASYNDLLAEEKENWLSVQRTAEIDLVGESKLDWQDHLRPIAANSDGFLPDVNEAPVTRWFETNTFYRQPTIIDKLRLRQDDFFEAVGQPDSTVSLIAPYTFANLCSNKAAIPAADNVRELYQQLFDAYKNRGVERVICTEYFDNPAPLRTNGIDAVQQLATAHPDITLSYLSAPRSPVVLPPKEQWPHNLVVSINPYTYQSLRRVESGPEPLFSGRELWHPLVQADSTNPDTNELISLNKNDIKYCSPARIVLTNTVDFEHVPLPYAQQKIRQLGSFAREFTEYIGGIYE